MCIRDRGKLMEIDAAHAPSPQRDAYRQAILKLIAPLSAKVGETAAANEDASLGSLRQSLAKLKARFGDPETVAKARALFTSGTGTPDQQRAALDVVATTADAATFDALLAKARATTDPLLKARILMAMAGVQDPILSARMVDIALGPDAPAGSAPGLLGVAGQTNPDAVWAALKPRLDTLPLDTLAVMRLVPRIAGASADPARISELDAYADKHIPADSRQEVERAKADIRLNARIRDKAVPDIDAWVMAHGGEVRP